MAAVMPLKADQVPIARPRSDSGNAALMSDDGPHDRESILAALAMRLH